MKQEIRIPASIQLFAKYLKNELTEEERIQFDRNVKHTQAEDKIYRQVKMLETIFPNDTHQMERLVRDNSEEYIKAVERLGCMGLTLDNIIDLLAKYQNAKKYENAKAADWHIAEEVFNLRS